MMIAIDEERRKREVMYIDILPGPIPPACTVEQVYLKVQTQTTEKANNVLKDRSASPNDRSVSAAFGRNKKVECH